MWYLTPLVIEVIEEFENIEYARARVRERECVLLWYVDSSSECVITVVGSYSLKLL